jgi:hypothetical protein
MKKDNKKLELNEIIKRSEEKGYAHAATFCHTENCCPVLSVNLSEPEDRQYSITDDFGNKIYMSKGQFEVMQRTQIDSK